MALDIRACLGGQSSAYVPGVLGEAALVLLVHGHHALQHHLGLGGDRDVHGLAADELHGLALKGSRLPVLAGDLGRGDEVERRVG